MSDAVRIVDVSAIVVTYNRDAVLRQTLECLLRQSPAPREIVVVDQTEKHDEETKRFLSDLSESGRIVYIFQEEANAQRARNRAIGAARAEVLLFIDDDVLLDEHLVGAHWKNYEDPELAAVCGFFLDPGERPTDELPDECSEPVTGWLHTPHSYTKRIESYLFPSGNGSVRRDVAVRVGGFDENFTYTHFDDTDFSCRLKALGVKAVHDPEAKLTHLRAERGGKRPSKINDYVIADSNRWYVWLYFFWMNFRWQGRREVLRRLRGCVFRRKNVARPWYMALAVAHLLRGGWRAAAAVRGGRKLGVVETR